jgi:hypothetical protein
MSRVMSYSRKSKMQKFYADFKEEEELNKNSAICSI